MYPFIHIGSFSLGTFGLFMWLAGVTGVFVLQWNLSRNVIKADAVVIVATVMIAGILGAKLWHELQHPVEFGRGLHAIIQPGWAHPIDILLNFLHWFQAGFAWFGGLLFGLAALVWQGRSLGIGGLRMLDLAAPAAAVGYGVGRIGCLTSGDGDYGINTTHPWGIHIKDNAVDPPVPNPPGLLVEPTPVYELAFGVVLGLYLWLRGRKLRSIGQITGEYLILSGIGRFLIEFLRRNERIYFGMSNAQIAALLTMLIGALLVLYAKTHGISPYVPVEEAETNAAPTAA